MTRKELAGILTSKTYGWSPDAAEMGIRASFRCEYCDRDMLSSVDAYDAWQEDHVIPQSRKGPDQVDNKALACKTCNFMKGDWDPRSELPEGVERAEYVQAARRYVGNKRAQKLAEIEELRSLVSGLQSL